MSKVALIACNDYDPEKVYHALKQAISLLGGIDKFVDKKSKVLLKPNMLLAKSKEVHATTHPVLFEAAIRLFREYTKDISYGDSPGFGSPGQVAKACGLAEVADRYKVPLADFETGFGKVLEAPLINSEFEIASAVDDNDCIINLCKMKAHQLTRITCAVKNMLGCVYGFNKVGFHLTYRNAIDFCKMLVDLNKLVPARLHIADGIMAMEGNGPSGGNPVKLGVILVSDDPVALDSVFCRLIDLDVAYVPTNTFGNDAGIGSFRDIEIVGDDFDTCRYPQFDVERSPVKDESGFGYLAWAKNLLLRRPVIDKNRCISCGICVKECPVIPQKALSFTKAGNKKPPRYDYGKCIRCYCCQEMCPEKAIFVRTPLLGKLLMYRSSEK